MPNPESPDQAKIDELPQQELTADEAAVVKGGMSEAVAAPPVLRKIENPRLIVPCV